MRPILRWLVGKAVSGLPLTRAYALKRALWRIAGVDLGRGVRVVSSARFLGPGEIAIGTETFIGHDVLVIATHSVRLGARCDVGPRVLISDGTHEIGGAARRAGRGIAEPVLVGDGTWIGAGAILTAGSTVGSGVVVAAGAVVTPQSEPNADVLLVGVPAKVKRQLQGPSP